MLPEALNIKNGSLSIDFGDETGITLTSPSGLSLNAGGEIAINTPSSVNISAQSQIIMTNGNSSNVSLEGEINVLGGATISNGSDRTAFPKFTDDEPQQVQLVVQPKGLEGRLITKDSAKLLKDANGNDISFLDACEAEKALNTLDLYNALNGNMPSCGSGAVIVKGNSNSGTDNSNSSNSSSNQWYGSVYYASPGNVVGIGGSVTQWVGEFGNADIPKGISNTIKPTYSLEYKNLLTAKSIQNAERYGDMIKLGDYIEKRAIVIDVGYSAYGDIINHDVPAGKVITNIVVNTTFDCTGLGASTAIGGLIGGPLGAAVGLGFGIVYIGVTQAWTPGGKSVQDRAKDSVYDTIKKAASTEPVYKTKIDEEGNYPEWMLHMK